ncbi:reprolysin (M12B) family zinc metalloprotease domain-containing protein [Ditylenchus destructor]|nr:reprolysin (M12B) family zinc metalloprotease domain-containing protein [Ditylenchus destructor]
METEANETVSGLLDILYRIYSLAPQLLLFLPPPGFHDRLLDKIEGVGMNNEQPSTSSDPLGLPDRVTSDTTRKPIRTRRTPHSKEVLNPNWSTSDGWADSDSGPCTKDPSFLWNGRWRRWTAERSKFRCYHLSLIIPAIFLILLWLTLNPIWPFGWYRSTKSGTSDQEISSESYNVIDDPKLTWVFSAHEFRRSQQKQNPRLSSRKRRSAESPVSFGLAEECGEKCSILLKASDITGSTEVQKQKLKVIFYRTSSLMSEIPLVQFMDSENKTHARSSSASSNCLYYAKVPDSKESSIANLCDKNGGVFGTLALHEGTFAIEPIENSAEDDDADSSSLETSKPRRRRRSTPLPNARAHRIYRIKSHSFEKPLSNDKLFPSFNDTAVFSASPKTTFSSLPFDATANFTMFSSTASSDDDLNNSSFISQNGNYLQFDSHTFRRRRSKRFANSWDNYVASIYRHPSLGASINIVVVRLIILKHETAGPRISNRAQETLQQFCTWQQNYNDGNDDAINHHDVAILLTRHDICRASNKCDTLGLAELGTMCDSVKSCAIIEDNGIFVLYVIFNIPHDDERKCAEFMPLNKNNYHIMAPTLEYNTNPWSWSPCSSHMLANSSRAQTQCILDQPVERRYFSKMFEYTAPGSTYSVNQQCQFVFGPSAEICPYMYHMVIKWVVEHSTCLGLMEHLAAIIG